MSRKVFQIQTPGVEGNKVMNIPRERCEHEFEPFTMNSAFPTVSDYDKCIHCGMFKIKKR